MSAKRGPNMTDEAVRRDLTAQLDNTYIVDERGRKRPLRKKSEKAE